MPNKPKEFICENCGIKFTTVNYKKDKMPKTCSYKCSGELKRTYKHVTKICPVCGKEFETVLNAEERNTCSIQCGNIYKNKDNNSIIHCAFCGKEKQIPNCLVTKLNFCNMDCEVQYNENFKWIKKVCPTCGKEFSTRISRETNYCSIGCLNRSSEKIQILQEKYTGVPLTDRGFSEEKLEVLTKQNKEQAEKMKGKSFEEMYGENKANSLKSDMSISRSGDENSMSLSSIAQRNDCSLKEASNLTPAKGRFGVLHPFYGKHHSILSKIQMMKTFGNGVYKNYIFSNGKFDDIFWQGTWELKYIIESIENDIPIKRYDLEPLEYIGEDGKKHHYFPDFIINEKQIVELKGNINRTNTENKKQSGVYNFGNDYIFIHKYSIGTSAKNFIRLMKEKYGERLIINYNPHEKKV